MLAAGTLARRFGYSGLLITLFALMFVAPLFGNKDWAPIVNGVLIITTAGTAIYAAGGSPVTQLVLGALALFYAVSHIMRSYYTGSGWDVLYGAAGATLFTLVALVLLRRILSVRTGVTAELIAGSVAVYLLLGIVFSFLFGLLHSLAPDAFVFADRAGHGDPDFYYFSLVTLTTLGYGDILPLHPIARSLAASEAVIGPLYLTVLVARLVGMHISVGSDTSGDQQ